ncbi:MAG: universal stress protein, partial [Pseudomonadota bacterium]
MIVCGTDFSTQSGAAATVAASLAKSLGCRLGLAYALPVGTGGDEKQHVALETEARRRLHAEAERLRGIGVVVQETLLEGSPDEALVSHARAVDAWLVVLSALGNREASRWLLG